MSRRSIGADRRTLITASGSEPERRNPLNERRGFDRRIGIDRRRQATSTVQHSGAALRYLPTRNARIGSFVDLHV